MVRRAGWAVPACIAAVLAAYFIYYGLDPRRPLSASVESGWWSFSDQRRYLVAALAWAAGDLDPARHYYLPGYPLLAAPFRWLTQANPFLIPDAACLVAGVVCTAGIARRLVPGWAPAGALGAAAFTLTALQPVTMEVWVTPWSTTPASALGLGCLWALLCLQSGWRPAAVAGACAGAIAAFRPSDAAVMLAIAGVAVLVARPAWRVVAAFAVGAAVPLAATAVAYLAVHGGAASEYLRYSAVLGFEWRLLPLRWVMLVLDPRPLLPGGTGLLATYPFIASGLAGLAACLAAPPGGAARRGHVLLAVTIVAQGALYLSYRDIHAPALWRNYNYHYFKALLPLLALYTALGMMALRRMRAVAAAGVVVVVLLPWRIELRPRDAGVAGAGNVLALPAGLGPGTGLAAAASGSFEAIYNGNANYFFGAAGRDWFGGTGTIAAYPVPGGVLLLPLRVLPPGPGRVEFDPAVVVDPGIAPRVVDFRLRYGLPCFLPYLAPAECRSPGVVPPPVMHPGTRLRFTPETSRVLVSGWTPAGADSLWTEGRRAGLRVRLDPAETGGLMVALEAAAFLPPGSDPLRVALLVAGRERARWVLAPDSSPELLAKLLPGDAAPDGTLDLVLVVENPRRPSDFLAGSADSRLLGLRVDSLTVSRSPGPR